MRREKFLQFGQILTFNSYFFDVFYTSCEFEIGFDLQNWLDNFRFTYFTKKFNQQRSGVSNFGLIEEIYLIAFFNDFFLT